ncbi:putative lipid II flippase FtsW [Anaerobacillus alkalidiazotrophicus]|uniref:Probable peptidoglycan glycosyltransferase FtsW n=1 Tax=Anaerobacillus alkalidiazotrophicus TaxID=472963 RepID=A0A1S2M5D3_9BACI|nr:putative lipid II flippase FtsW [Anaerobacillus alkalidiazotrophicus]OIJ18194.1 putative lipid II flippase FtsW [Anaerobacillus alkalidiazotrophicus]OIJ19673.1 putative lipid II flippase FtsW [Anaerobacillus alkalidiazotrophicus]
MENSVKKESDWILLTAIILLASFGLIMIYSSSYVVGFDKYGDPFYYFKKQLQWIAVSTVLFIIFMRFPYRFYQKLVFPIVFLSFLSLSLVVFSPLGVESNGATRWLNVGMILQPSEFVKLGIIIYLAHVYSRKQKYINQFTRGVMPPLLIVGGIFLLIMKQPDLGTAGLILAVAGLIVFCSGAKLIHLFGLGGFAAFIVWSYANSESYRMDRLIGFMDPFADSTGTGYQLIQSYIAMAHGGITGAGFGQSVQKLFYLPEAHTDFILAIVAEELGLLGILFVFICLGVILFRGILIGVRSNTPFGSLLAFGITFQLTLQVCLNVGAVSGLLPITGIPLPFMSYGGSSLLITAVSVGILANIARNNTIKSTHNIEHDKVG